jgi:hypothetical protein
MCGVGCSYALNRALCRWFDIPKDELAIIHLQPTVRSYEHVDVRNAAQADTLCIEVEVLSWQQLRVGPYPFAPYPHLLTENCYIPNPLVDLLFVECSSDTELQSATIRLAFGHSRGAEMMQANTAAAILLDEGSADANALYAVPLCDEIDLQSSADVATYMHCLLAWTNASERGACPVTWFSVAGQTFEHVGFQLAEAPPGCQIYLWAFSCPPTY